MKKDRPASPAPARRRDKTRRRGGWWRWLGLGALGLALLTLLRPAGARRPRRGPGGERPRGGRRSRGRHSRGRHSRGRHSRGHDRRGRDRDPSAAPGDPDADAGAIATLPADVETAWVPGPAGALRVCERHPEGGRAIVFVHGLGGRAEHWAAQIAACGPGLRAVALDLPGHGGSARAAVGEHTIALAAAAIGAALDALGLRRAVLVGHSIGALAAIDYAASHPARVAGLLLVDPPGDQTRAPAQDRRGGVDAMRRDPLAELEPAYRQLLVGARPEVADAVLADLRATAPEVLAELYESAAGYAALDALARCRASAWSIVGDRNVQPYALHRLRPELEARHLGDAGHWLMMDRPRALRALLVEFLDQLDARAPRR